VNIPTTVRGDFEITVSFEILQEPGRADVGAQPTRFTLDAVLDRPGKLPGSNVATLSRRVDKSAGTQFYTWRRLWNEDGGVHEEKGNGFPTRARSGRLRLVRSGSEVSFLVAEGSVTEFTFLHKYSLGTDDLKSIHLLGSTGSSTAALDVRVTDLRVRADSLPNRPDPGVAAPKALGKGWLTAGLALALVLAAGAGAGLWLGQRHRRGLAKLARITSVPDRPLSFKLSVPPLSFACGECGKDLKVKPELAGKKIKCPQCGQAVAVPSLQAGPPGGV
jgi:hypothetical protein